jgi:hypothetical protein
VTTTCATAPCTDPVNAITYPSAAPANASPPPAATFFNAQTNSGMGDLRSPRPCASIAANTYAGTYTSTLTLSIASGP